MKSLRLLRQWFSQERREYRKIGRLWRWHPEIFSDDAAEIARYRYDQGWRRR